MADSLVQLAAQAKSVHVDAVGLAEALRTEIRGEVRFDNSTRALYATDGSNYRQVPIGVVLPRDDEDVIAALFFLMLLLGLTMADYATRPWS